MNMSLPIVAEILLITSVHFGPAPMAATATTFSQAVRLFLWLLDRDVALSNGGRYVV